MNIIHSSMDGINGNFSLKNTNITENMYSMKSIIKVSDISGIILSNVSVENNFAANDK